ncbi:MAG: RNA methyltransferase [Candidatus Krumholzibacteriia bacterium]
MLGETRIVLVQPAHAGNVGAVARAMKNMGFCELWLVAPQFGDADGARRLAHGAEDILDAARRVESLAEALAGCCWGVAATRRAGRRRDATHTPRSLAEAVRREPARRPLALVFGPEKDGLTAAELEQCHDVLTIPASAAHPSLNLAQAVVVVAYELFVACLDAKDRERAARRSADASCEELEGLYAHLEEVLLEVGFVSPETASHQMRALRRLLGRARPRPEEVTRLRGICRQILWAVRSREPQSRRNPSSRG